MHDSSGHKQRAADPAEQDGSLFAEMLTSNALRTVEVARAMLEGIPPESFARQPLLENQPIFTNHPAFVFGHLSLYPARVLKMAGFDPKPAAAPYWYDELFGPDAICRDDPYSEIYPSMDEVTTQYFVASKRAIAYIQLIPDHRLVEPHTFDSDSIHFHSLGAAAEYLLNNHVMFHLGQISAWRRCIGMGQAEL